MIKITGWLTVETLINVKGFNDERGFLYLLNVNIISLYVLLFNILPCSTTKRKLIAALNEQTFYSQIGSHDMWASFTVFTIFLLFAFKNILGTCSTQNKSVSMMCQSLRKPNTNVHKKETTVIHYHLLLGATVLKYVEAHLSDISLYLCFHLPLGNIVVQVRFIWPFVYIKCSLHSLSSLRNLNYPQYFRLKPELNYHLIDIRCFYVQENRSPVEFRILHSL